MSVMLKLLPLSAALLLSLAAAHATVRTETGLTESKVGASETYRLNVPVEKELQTTEVRLVVPAGMTITRFQIMPGFTRTMTKNAAGLVTEVIWKGRIAPMEYARFFFTALNPTTASSVNWKIYQKYSDGSVAAWDGSDPEKAPGSIITLK